MATDGSAKPTGDAPRRVIVKFRDAVVMPYEDGAERYLTRLGIGPWAELAHRFDGIRLKRLFTVVSPERIGELVAEASDRDRRYRAPNLLTFFAIDCTGGLNAGALAAALREWSNVETAYVDPLDLPPGPVGANPDRAKQTYLKAPATAPPPAPQGAIDAEFAWIQLGGSGVGQKIVDLERGAKLDHEDLPAGIPTLHGVIDFDYVPHGTSVLGILAAVDNDKGVVGIAYGVDQVAYSCQVLADHITVDRINAVMAAVQYFTQPAEQAFGRVLLLEVQLSTEVNPNDQGQLTDVNGVVWELMPMETSLADFEVIRLATALGIVVVEPTGNGINDLDAFQQAATGAFVLSRTQPGGRDSGAIMVGGSSSDYPYKRSVSPQDPSQGTNFGSRVDCFAWAEHVCTCACEIELALPPRWKDDLTYPKTFDGTSAAAAIVAGAVLLVQGVSQASPLGRRLSPAEMRALISNSNPAINTRSANYGVDRIGVMPNLKGILNALGAAPDVYLRDYVGDTGDVHAGAISLSPDIIVRPLGEANPDVTFGPGTESDLMLGPTATFGQDNYVYVRVWNRANVDAANVTATVFYAAVATLLMPVDWKLIGSVLIPNVAKNNVMTVSTPITWPSANVPAQGHYCFIALVGNAQDPAPNPATFLTFDNYYAFIRSNNNVTWRNFNVIDEPVPVLARAQERRAGASAQGVPQDRGNRGESYALEFSAPGAVDSDRDFVLAVGSRLPLDANLWLEAPVSLLDERLPITASGQEPQMGRVAIGPHGRTALPAVLFPARSRSLCRLLVDMPLEPPQANSEVYVSQLYEGFEVGRVTWRIIPKK